MTRLLTDRAAANGRTLDAEIREILTREARRSLSPVAAWLQIAARFRGTELEAPDRRPARDLALS